MKNKTQQNIAIIVSGGEGTRFKQSLLDYLSNNVLQSLPNILVRSSFIDAFGEVKINTKSIFANKKVIGFSKQNLILSEHNLSIVEKSVISFSNNDLIDTIIVVKSKDTDINYLKHLKISQDLFFVESGETRLQSVANALLFIKNNINFSNNGNVLIHDAARPFINNNIITSIAQSLDNKDFYGSIPCIQSSDTIKQFSVEKGIATLDRNLIYQAQTPQGFVFDKIFECYKKLNIFDNQNFHNNSITDDS